jgi:hypothetical protein
MQNHHRLSVRIAPIVGSLLATFGFVAACGEPGDAGASVEGKNALAWCAGDSECAEAGESTESAPAAWLTRCASDSECEVGQCVCGLCSQPCNGEATACSELPEGAACFSGRDIARGAVCHASTVPGICLPACNPGDDCGEGFICALGACLPKPPAER